MKLEWKDADDVVARVGEVFMTKVLENSGVGSGVRFGLMGNGTFPNYQVEFKDPDRTLLFSGTSHKEWTGDVKEFDSSRISPQFPREVLLDAFLQRFRKKYTPPTKR